MAKIKARKRDGGQIEMHAMLTEDEARRLCCMVQNPIFEEEDPSEEAVRAALFNALTSVVRIPGHGYFVGGGELSEIPF